MTRTLVVVGHGMAGHRLVELARSGSWRFVVLGEESRPAYDRMALSSYLDGKSAEDLSLAGPGWAADPAVDLRLSTTVTRVDRAVRAVHTSAGERIGYDALVLATGSRPLVPPVPGADLAGTFVYRTLDDLDAIRAAATPGRPGVVIGGGLLGLEAANALRCAGMRVHVIELAPRLLPLQVDAAGGEVLHRLVSALGLTPHCGERLLSVHGDSDGQVTGVTTKGSGEIEADVVVFATGVRPRDELAGPAQLPTGPRGGFLVDDRCRTPDTRIWAIGECAAVNGRCYGLVAPGYRMAEVVANQLLGTGSHRFADPDLSTRLKLLGIDVATFGDAHAESPGAVEMSLGTDDTYGKLVVAGDSRTLLGGMLVGDLRGYSLLHSLVGHELPAPPEQLLFPPRRPF